MDGSAFFRRVTRFIASEDHNPAEDQLTQITSVALERVPGLARSLALQWLSPEAQAMSERATPATVSAWDAISRLPADAAVATRTQVRYPNRVVDLELRFHSGPSALASDVAAIGWVEVKHGTKPHSGQLADYVGLRPPYPGAVVLLSPRADLPVGNPCRGRRPQDVSTARSCPIGACIAKASVLVAFRRPPAAAGEGGGSGRRRCVVLRPSPQRHQVSKT
jgi:hypothetical protein